MVVRLGSGRSAGLGCLWWAAEDAGTGLDRRRKERGEAGLLLGAELGPSCAEPAQTRARGRESGWACGTGPRIGLRKLAHTVLYSFSYFSCLLGLDSRHCTFEKFQVKLKNSSQIVLFLFLPKNHIKYALFTHKNIFQRLKSRQNKGENYI